MSVPWQQLGASCWRAEGISRFFLHKVLMGTLPMPDIPTGIQETWNEDSELKNQLFGEDSFYVPVTTKTHSRLREGWDHIENSCFDDLWSLERFSRSPLVFLSQNFNQHFQSSFHQLKDISWLVQNILNVVQNGIQDTELEFKHGQWSISCIEKHIMELRTQLR